MFAWVSAILLTIPGVSAGSCAIAPGASPTIPGIKYLRCTYACLQRQDTCVEGLGRIARFPRVPDFYQPRASLRCVENGLDDTAGSYGAARRSIFDKSTRCKEKWDAAVLCSA